MSETTHQGRCFCGAVEISTKGAPVVMGYCHCSSCRAWSASPVNAFTLWKPEDVAITHGQDQVEIFHKTDRSYREFCRRCGGHLKTSHPGFKLVDVYAAVLDGFSFVPAVHVHYGEKVLALRDGLPKFKDMPKEMGGSGETLPD